MPSYQHEWAELGRRSGPSGQAGSTGRRLVELLDERRFGNGVVHLRYRTVSPAMS